MRNNTKKNNRKDEIGALKDDLLKDIEKGELKLRKLQWLNS